MQDESGNSSPVAREQASALPPTTNKAASITSKLVMADVKQTRALRPKGPLFPIRPPTAPTSYTVPKRAGAALDLVTAKDDGKPITFNGRDTPQPFLDPSYLDKRRGGGGGWIAQKIRDETK